MEELEFIKSTTKEVPQESKETLLPKNTEDYCSLCRLSHSQGKKHSFTKRHTNTVEKIISKEQEKVISCQLNAKNPTVSVEVEENKSWCYFCSCEITKDLVVNNVAIDLLGLANHLCANVHQRKMVTFCQLQRVNKVLQAKLILDSSEVAEFIKKGNTAREEFLQKINFQQQNVVDAIRRVEEKRQLDMHAWSGEKKFTAGDSNASCSNFTAAPSAEPIPPWLMDDVLPSIGPSELDLNSHQRKLSTNTKFGQGSNSSSNSSSTWLPAFGGVWCKNRRSKKQQFEQRFSKRGRNNKRPHSDI